MENAIIERQTARTVIVATKKTLEEKNRNINWDKLVLGYLIPCKLPFELISSLVKGKSDPLEKYRKVLPYPIIDHNDVPSNMFFPPQHPIDGCVYASCDAEPNIYIPLSQFHTYMYQSKLSAFIEMCANLGAKTCKIIYAEENGQEITQKFKMDNIPTSIGLIEAKEKFSFFRKHKESNNLYFEFPKTVYEIKQSNSLWLNGEPSWRAFQNIRASRDIKSFKLDFCYEDEMGINAEVALGVNKLGFDIGGSFKEIAKTKVSFEVEFWKK